VCVASPTVVCSSILLCPNRRGLGGSRCFFMVLHNNSQILNEQTQCVICIYNLQQLNSLFPVCLYGMHSVSSLSCYAIQNELERDFVYSYRPLTTKELNMFPGNRFK
jgi:hypothetical protein